MRVRVTLAAPEKRKYWKKKPQGRQIAGEQLAVIIPTELELSELAELITKGCTFRAAACSGRQDETFQSQQLFAIDIDNDGKSGAPDLKPEDAVKRAQAAGLRPCLVYHSFSSTAEKPRYRVLFIMSEPLKDRKRRDRVMSMLLRVFPEADKVCSSESHLFFGSNKPAILTDMDAVNDLTAIEKLAAVSAPEQKKKAQKTAETSKQTQNNGALVAIAHHDARYFQKKFNVKPQKFADNVELFRFLYEEVDLSQFLELPLRKPFCCIFHDDKKPSASIFVNQYGQYVYHCFSGKCEAGVHDLNIKTVCEKIGKFRSVPAVVKFLKSCFMAEVEESEAATEALEIILDIRHTLENGEIPGALTGKNHSIFAERCPQAWKNLNSHALKTFSQVLGIATEARFSMTRTERGELIFSFSRSRLEGSSRQTIDADIKQLCYHGMLREMPDSEIPPELLKRANARRRKNESRIAFFAISSFVVDVLTHIEHRGNMWRAGNYRKGSLSYESIFRTDGEQLAREVFPQYSVLKSGEIRKPTEKAERHASEIEKEVLRQLLELGYATEKAVVETLAGDKSAGEQRKEMKTVQKVIAEIAQKYNLQRIKADSRIKKQFNMNVPERAYPFIYVRMIELKRVVIEEEKKIQL